MLLCTQTPLDRYIVSRNHAGRPNVIRRELERFGIFFEVGGQGEKDDQLFPFVLSGTPTYSFNPSE